MIKWYASCAECTMSHYTPNTRSSLIMAFDDQYERNKWAFAHMLRTGHRIVNYFRRISSPVPYPTEPGDCS